MQEKRRSNDASRMDQLAALADDHPEFKLIIAADLKRLANGQPLEGEMTAEELRARLNPAQ